MANELSNSVVVPAALAGVVVGATVATLEFAYQLFFDSESASRLLVLSIFWIGALIVFLIGFIVLGVPAWVVAHLFNRRHWYDALVVSAVLAGGSEMLWSLPSPHSSFSGGGVDWIIDGHFTPAGWTHALTTAAMVAVAGAAAGLTIWRIAYRRKNSVGKLDVL